MVGDGSIHCLKAGPAANGYAVDRNQPPAEQARVQRDARTADAQIVEIVQHVALNTWTNYLNEAIGTEVDFPVVAPFAAAGN